MKRNYEIGIIGCFGFGKQLRNGQTVKTQQLESLLKRLYGTTNVLCVDTHGWQRTPWRLFFVVINACRHCKRVIMLPAHGAVKIIPRLCLMSRKPDVKLFYDVIGGWLPDFIDDKPGLKKALLKLDGIWVETEGMQKKLEERGFSNTVVIPNFKDLKIRHNRQTEVIEHPADQPRTYVFTIFSRITKEKGVEDAIDTIVRYNRENQERGDKKACLKIYGQIPESYQSEFNDLVQKHRDCVEYHGIVSPEKSVDVLAESYMLLFPTHYPGEGFPGTIIDAYASGVPVIASDWRYNGEIVRHGETGFLYPTFDNNTFYSLLCNSIEHESEIALMRKNCLEEAEKFTTEASVPKIRQQLNI